jgi:3-dehydroquinate dehydratase-2
LTLSDIQAQLSTEARALGVSIDFFQSNSEGELIDRVQAAPAEGTEIAIINPGGYSHTSVALRDAFLGVSLPLIEVHVSNIYQRESFRHHSYFSDISVGSLVGFGPFGYSLALIAAATRIRQ